MSVLKTSERFPVFPLARCEAMGEGARRAGEGSLVTQRMLLKALLVSRKSPHPAFGHLLPRCAREKGNEGAIAINFTEFPVT